MKKITILILFATVFLSSGTSRGQFTKASWEISLTGGFNSLSESSSSGSSSSDNLSMLSFNISPGYYFIDGLSLEPEIGMFSILSPNSSGKSYFKLVGNVSYTFQTQEKGFAPYIKAGIGTSNGLQIGAGNSSLISTFSDNYSAVTILDAGIGIKFLVGKSAAIRTELNYLSQSYKYSSSYSESPTYTLSNIGLVLGLSLIFPSKSEEIK